MPNRGQTQDQNQKGRQNPGTISPDDDEVQDADQTPLDAQNEPRGRKKRRDAEPLDEQTTVETDDEELEDGESEEPIGGRP